MKQESRKITYLTSLRHTCTSAYQEVKIVWFSQFCVCGNRAAQDKGFILVYHCICYIPAELHSSDQPLFWKQVMGMASWISITRDFQIALTCWGKLPQWEECEILLGCVFLLGGRNLRRSRFLRILAIGPFFIDKIKIP